MFSHQKVVKEEKTTTTTEQQQPGLQGQTVQVQPVQQQQPQQTNIQTRQPSTHIEEQQIQNPDGSVTTVRKEVRSDGTVVDDVESKLQMEKQQRKMEGAAT